jgi:hypothetical protein
VEVHVEQSIQIHDSSCLRYNRLTEDMAGKTALSWRKLAVGAAALNESITGILTMAGMSNLSSIVALVGFGLFDSFAFYLGSKKLVPEI